MRVLNSNSCFSGHATVCGKSVYINTSTGAGFCEVFDLMGKSISTFASTITRFYPYDTYDDARQDVCLMVLEGVLKYDSKKGAALSTFLHTYISSRITDLQRKKYLQFKHVEELEDIAIKFNDLDSKIELVQRTKNWDNKWKEVIFRIFVNGDKIADVAKDESMTPWGLTRAVRRKLDIARHK